MEALFELCAGWRNCDNEELRNLHERKILKGKNFKISEENEFEKYNEICRNCNHSLEIEEDRCPVCGDKNLQGSPLVSFHKEQPYPIPITSVESGGITQYFYRCESCKRLLYSHKKF